MSSLGELTVFETFVALFEAHVTKLLAGGENETKLLDKLKVQVLLRSVIPF